MTERVEAAAKPALLVWAREDAGFTHAEVAKKLGVKVERLEAWEQGEKNPTITQLRKLGKLYRRPIAVFYLDAPPTTFRPMHDYRRLPGEVAGHESAALPLQVRRAYERREIALDLYGSLRGSSTTAVADPKTSTSFMIVPNSFPALLTNFPGVRCLTHVGTEGRGPPTVGAANTRSVRARNQISNMLRVPNALRE